MAPAEPDLSCRDAIEFLAAYLDGELAPAVAAAFEAHLSVCAACVEYLSDYAQTIRLAREAEELPGEVPEELVRAIVAARPRR
jgi:predicted anti-sigma-YlaC factor YlaD